MAKDNELEVKKQELATAESTERTRDARVFIPQTDIYEDENKVVVFADMPGVAEDKLDITLDKNILTLIGTVDNTPPEGYRLEYAEYAVGDYQRNFVLSNEIDRDKIEATMKNGVLKLVLPKAAAAKSRKISVRAE